MLGCTVFKYETYQIHSKLTFLPSFEETRVRERTTATEPSPHLKILHFRTCFGSAQGRTISEPRVASGTVAQIWKSNFSSLHLFPLNAFYLSHILSSTEKEHPITIPGPSQSQTATAQPSDWEAGTEHPCHTPSKTRKPFKQYQLLQVPLHLIQCSYSLPSMKR